MIKGFLPVSFVDWPGKICSVLFVGGCNFRCPWCHNKLLAWCSEELPDVDVHCGDREFVDLMWIDGITITGGEPTIHSEIAEAICGLRDAGVPVKLDTNGSLPRVIERSLSCVAAVYMDVKAPIIQDRYSSSCGVSVNILRIKRSIDLLREWDGEVVFRTTQHPGISDDDILRIKEYLGPEAEHIIQEYRSVD